MFHFTSFLLPIFPRGCQGRGEISGKNTIKLKCVTSPSGRDCELIVREGGCVAEGDDSYWMITCRCYVMMESIEVRVCMCLSEITFRD